MRKIKALGVLLFALLAAVGGSDDFQCSAIIRMNPQTGILQVVCPTVNCPPAAPGGDPSACVRVDGMVDGILVHSCECDNRDVVCVATWSVTPSNELVVHCEEDRCPVSEFFECEELHENDISTSWKALCNCR